MSAKFNIRELDFRNIGAWPLAARSVFFVLVALAVVAAGWYLLLSSQQDELRAQESKERELRAKYETVSAKARNLGPLKEQLGLLEEQLKTVLRQLPSKTEMPDLIVDISQTAVSTGIHTELFKPGGETLKEFYAEKPIAIRMSGNYHQFGGFVSGVASLPRMVIMTMHDITLRPAKGEGIALDGSVPLELSGTVKTYRYLDEEETVAQEALAAKAEKAKKKKAKAKADAEKPAEPDAEGKAEAPKEAA